MKEYTDKQLLQMTKTELVSLYRELEKEKEKAKENCKNVEKSRDIYQLTTPERGGMYDF